jgi:ubiquinone/menaquinone biosynthesis C-methylase UbiE
MAAVDHRSNLRGDTREKTATCCTLRRVLDPVAWNHPRLPETWADRLSITTPAGFWTYLSGPFRSLFRRPRSVRLPPELPGGQELPSYLLQEFHGMPNGYYSMQISVAYARGFERVMLQRMQTLRASMAAQLAGRHAVLDVGCGAGHLAETLHGLGAGDVWGLDACPYALTVAASRVPRVRFVHGLAEATGFSDARFDAVTVCFVLHELPRAALERGLAEFRRILRPGGRLVIGEPSPVHVRGSWVDVIRHHGLVGAYYKALARLVFEPFLSDWLAVDLPEALARHGFRLELDRSGVPFREVVAVRAED